MDKRITLMVLIFCLVFLGVGCSDLSVLANPARPTVNQALPTKTSLNHKTIELRNCDGKTEHQSLADQVQVVCNITFPDQAISTTTGGTLELSTEMKSLLADQVQRTYQQMYEDEKTGVEETDLAVPVGRIRTFTVYWTRQTINSTVSFTQDDQTYSASYTYTLDIPDATISMETGCTA